jgi:2-dehydropantoate 2-reductase
LKDIVIVGAGAMGSLFGARLVEAGAAVTLVDVDEARISLINHQGLLLVDDHGERRVSIRASHAREFSGPVDLVMLFTKGLHSRAAVQSVAHLAGLQPVALTLQNGIGNAEILAETFGPDRVLVGTAHVPADIEPPDRVISHGFARVHLGGFTEAAQPYADAVAEILQKAKFEPIVTAKPFAAVWEKLAFNAALNALAMITEARNGQMDNEAGLRIAQAIVEEAVAVARARGIVLDAEAIRQTVKVALAKHPSHEASMLQDRRAGRPTEIESINGAVARVGAELGVPTPITSTLADLVRVIEAKSAESGRQGAKD